MGDFDGGAGERIRAARRRAGLTQAEFGRLAGVSQSYLSEVERGKSKPSVEILIGVAEHCPEVSLHWLLTGEGQIEAERADYLGGNATRRITILRAMFAYVFELLDRMLTDKRSAEERSHIVAGAFFTIASAGMLTLEEAYDAGEHDERALKKLLSEVHQRRSK